MTCATCAYFQSKTRNDGDPGGECRIAPPTGFPVPNQHGRISVHSFWPPTREGDWCGKHELSKVTAKDSPSSNVAIVRDIEDHRA